MIWVLLASLAHAGDLEARLVDAHAAPSWTEARDALVLDQALPDEALRAESAADWRASLTATAVLAWRTDADAALAVWNAPARETRGGTAMIDARVGQSVPSVLAERLVHKGENPGLRAALVDQLRRTDADWVGWIAGVLASDDSAAVRAVCAETMRYADGPVAVEALRTGLADADPMVRAAAARGAGWSKAGPGLVAELLAATSDGDHSVAGYAARSLGWLGAADAFDAVAAVTEGPDWRARLAALRAMERLDAARAASHPSVLAALSDADARVSRAAGQISGG
jgi:hypothetical protein